ncbi:MAG: hypothetical protein JWL59_2386 [Chthoniobacteraceae bacterium]|nr:hypothetical protein [Chthoniobacteraceae bacterium]
MRSFKHFSHTAIAILCSLLSAISTRAAAEPATQWSVLGECQMIVLGQKAALKLLPDLRDAEKIEAACVQLDAMIESNEAILSAYLIIRSFDQKLGNARDAELVRYPAEFNPPALPPALSDIPPEKLLEITKAWPLFGVIPGQFEEREIGATLDLTVSVEEGGKLLNVVAEPKHARFLGKRITRSACSPPATISGSNTRALV